ncbi:MAG: patatin-like phospholipase family protein, partial [Devosia sp.]|nr:patatin-like phospholipase family protein [Devosia sp.]
MRIGVALGSGAARGLAHIPYIEAMDELGLKPSVIAGSSIGALIGSGWANGMSGAELREHAYSVLGSLQQIASTLWNRNRFSFKQMVEDGLSMQVNSMGITTAFLPDGFPDDFAHLKVPFSVVATDFYAWKEMVFESGPLRPAIAASLAIPSLFRPVSVEGR